MPGIDREDVATFEGDNIIFSSVVNNKLDCDFIGTFVDISGLYMWFILPATYLGLNFLATTSFICQNVTHIELLEV